LQGVTLEELAEWVVNPYDPPPQGSDDPHQGIDLSDRNNPDGIALSGMPVQAVLAGKVAGFTIERFPYGNMLMIESPLEVVLSAGLPTEALPTTLPELLEGGALSCPDLNLHSAGNSDPRSVYILYAHLQSPPAFALGEEIQCGQEIGAIGNSGNALNPHLHLEVRVGPAGQTFDSMAHYDNSATPAEMAAYCTWRVSGLFQTVNPACLWGDCP
jgi:murein DD-endopeptidase MepM/ murein hydrolase activator NlpD